MLNNENYFSQENELKYFGSSQFKSFMDCEARTMAEIKGEWERPKSDALLIGSYVDAYWESEEAFERFKAEHAGEMFKKNGELLKKFENANNIIERTESDPMFAKYMSGETQLIKTGKIFGHDFKIKIDSYHPGKAIVDLKCMRDFEKVYKEGLGRVNFIDGWGYDIQGAIYQAVEGNKLPVIIAGCTKQNPPDLGLFRIPQYKLDAALKIVEAYIDHFADVKSGLIEPARCGKCEYCRATKRLTKIEILEDIINE